MSENIPESIPTSADPRSKRPLKRLRGPDTPATRQAGELDKLFSNSSVNPVPEIDNAITTFSSRAAPEIVNNVQGSSAGAGSGEFHVYKASRRREYERMRAMDEEVKGEEDAEKWERERKERFAKDEETTRKKREKRMRKGKGKGGKVENLEKSGGMLPRVVTGASEENDPAYEQIVAVEEVGVIIHDDN